jgi:hypothetical protein
MQCKIDDDIAGAFGLAAGASRLMQADVKLMNDTHEAAAQGAVGVSSKFQSMM